jgi:hypothetical protein
VEIRDYASVRQNQWLLGLIAWTSLVIDEVIINSAADIDPHMRGCGTFLDVHDRTLNRIASAKPHDCFSPSVGKIRMPEYRLEIY